MRWISREPFEHAYELFPKTDAGDFCWKNVKTTFDDLNARNYFRAIEEKGKIVLQHKFREQEVLKNVWVDKKYQSEFNGTNLLKSLIGENNFSYPKSIYAVMDIVKIMSGKGDIVLDFFAGSGTTAHAVLQANMEQNINDRRFILCEQLDEHIDITIRRLQAVLSKTTTKGNFVYCELLKSNQKFIDSIQSAHNDEDLIGIWKEMLKTGFVSYKVKPLEICMKDSDFVNLSMVDKKRILMDLLDMNQLYVNFCDIDDEAFRISEEDKTFSKSFYKES